MQYWGIAALLLSSSCLGQGQMEKEPTFILPTLLLTLHGELKIEGEGRPQDYAAEIEPCRKQRGSEKTSISANGQFEFRNLRPNCYVVRIVVGAQSQVVKQQNVEVQSNTVTVQFVVRPNEIPKPASGYVSMKELASPPPKKAVKAFEEGKKKAAEGRTQEAADQFQRALQIDPGYAEAHLELGSLLLERGQAKEARAEFAAARQCGLESPEVLGSLALALAELGQAKDAEATARAALARQPTNARANYALGSALLYRSTDYRQIVEPLEKAAPQIPMARLLASKVRVKYGDLNGAVQDLEEFLKVCPPDKRPAAEAMLRDLRQQAAVPRRERNPN